MGLFGNKCALCGTKVNVVNQKKCADGYICKECNKKLSPYTRSRREMSLAEVNNEIRLREQNQQLLPQLKPTHIFGDFGVILIDTLNHKFCAVPDTSPGMFKSNVRINELNDVIPFNPDIIDMSRVKSVDLKITCNEKEEKKTVGDKQVSYIPKHMTYMCNFTLNITLEGHPFIDHMYLQLNDGALHIKTKGERKVKLLWDTKPELELTMLNPNDITDAYENNQLLKAITGHKISLPDRAYGFNVDQYNISSIETYHYYLVMAKKIENLLMNK